MICVNERVICVEDVKLDADYLVISYENFELT